MTKSNRRNFMKGAAGGVVAVKGLGGYHLACSATSTVATEDLRRRKGRAAKPFAVMVADLDAARRLAVVDDAEAALLTSAARPIVLVRARTDSTLSPAVAPGSPLVGITQTAKRLGLAPPEITVATKRLISGFSVPVYFVFGPITKRRSGDHSSSLQGPHAIQVAGSVLKMPEPYCLSPAADRGGE